MALYDKERRVRCLRLIHAFSAKGADLCRCAVRSITLYMMIAALPISSSCPNLVLRNRILFSGEWSCLHSNVLQMSRGYCAV